MITPVLFKELAQKQKELSEKIILKTPDNFKLEVIAGCDCSILNQEYILAVFVNFKYPSLEVMEVVYDFQEITIPYVPGYLAFREIPTLLKAYKKLKKEPDLIMVDGNGIIHPRKMGIAAHLGVVLNKPTLGVAKNLLYGSFKAPGPLKGSYTNVIDKTGVQIGYALRSKDNIKSVFVSPGHLLSMKDSLSISLSTLRKHKLPEPTRIADKYSKNLKKTVDWNN